MLDSLSPMVTKGRWLARQFWARREDFRQPSFWLKSGRIAARLGQAALWPKDVFDRTLATFEKRPWNLHIEPTNACNADCVFCAYQYMERPKKVMPMDLYRKALGDYVDMGGGDLLLEVVVGDPVLDPTFLDKVRLARSYAQIDQIATITNGIGLDRMGADKLVESGISKVAISTASFEEENYVALYRNKSYDKMRGNVLDLLKANERAGRPVEVTIGFRTNRRLEDVLADPDFQEIKRYRPLIDFTFSFSSWGGKIDFADLPPGFIPRGQPPQVETCAWLYDGPIVFANGEVGLCGCQDVEAKSDLVVGNIRDRSLYEIWNSPRVAELRRGFTAPETKPNICRVCTSYRNLDANRSAEGLRRAFLTEGRLRGSACHRPVATPKGQRRLPIMAR
jgi:MoaA/NifB/PqqE/SkfB family radical SAM enzyme